jgi:hypothetical protein
MEITAFLFYPFPNRFQLKVNSNNNSINYTSIYKQREKGLMCVY